MSPGGRLMKFSYENNVKLFQVFNFEEFHVGRGVNLTIRLIIAEIVRNDVSDFVEEKD